MCFRNYDERASVSTPLVLRGYGMGMGMGQTGSFSALHPPGV